MLSNYLTLGVASIYHTRNLIDLLWGIQSTDVALYHNDFVISRPLLDLVKGEGKRGGARRGGLVPVRVLEPGGLVPGNLFLYKEILAKAREIFLYRRSNIYMGERATLGVVCTGKS